MNGRSKAKGTRIERKIVNMLKSSGIDATRVPLSGAAKAAGKQFKSDILIRACGGMKHAEVKSRASGEGFKTLKRWLGDNDFLFLHENKADPLVVMSWDSFINLYGVWLYRLESFSWPDEEPPACSLLRQDGVSDQ